MVLDVVFSLFGRKAVGQVIAATVIGAMLAGLLVLGPADRPPAGEWSAWLIGGAAGGLTAGLILVSPRVFFGALFGLVGLVLAIVPMSHTDGTAATLGEHAVKLGIGVGLMVLGIILVASRIRKLASDRAITPHRSAAPAADGTERH